MMRITGFFCLWLLSFSLSAQRQDHLVTLANDSLAGEVHYRPNISFSDRISIRLHSGEKKKFRFADIKSFRRANEDFVIHPCLICTERHRKHYLVYKVLTGPPLELMEEHLFEDNVNYPNYMVRFNDSYYLINTYYLSNLIWEKLNDCEDFRKKYGSFKETHSEKNWLIIHKYIHKWKEMIEYYNETCG